MAAPKALVPKTFTTGVDPDLIQIRLRNSAKPPP